MPSDEFFSPCVFLESTPSLLFILYNDTKLWKKQREGDFKMFRRKGFFPGKMSCPCMFLRLKNLSFQKRDSVVGFSIWATDTLEEKVLLEHRKIMNTSELVRSRHRIEYCMALSHLPTATIRGSTELLLLLLASMYQWGPKLCHNIILIEVHLVLYSSWGDLMFIDLFSTNC